MEKTAEQVYTDLLRQVASPSASQPGMLADLFRDVERMHSMGHITDWQLENRQRGLRQNRLRSRQQDRRRCKLGHGQGEGHS